MSRLISRIILSIFLATMPATASIASASTATDESVLRSLETVIFTHPDEQRSIDDRVARLESFVFGMTKSGNTHGRIRALKLCIAPPEDTAQVSRAASTAPSHQLAQPARSTANDRESANNAAHRHIGFSPVSSVSYKEPSISWVPQIVIPKKARVQTVFTVVDRIESLEMDVFGRKECAKKLQVRVSRLEKSLLGSDYGTAPETITYRVNRLWCTYNGQS
jgi:hypothetical protein